MRSYSTCEESRHVVSYKVGNHLPMPTLALLQRQAAPMDG